MLAELCMRSLQDEDLNAAASADAAAADETEDKAGPSSVREVSSELAALEARLANSTALKGKARADQPDLPQQYHPSKVRNCLKIISLLKAASS